MENDEAQVPKFTKLYSFALDQFKLRTLLLIIERIYVIVTMFVIFAMQTQNCAEWSSLTYWALCSGIQAIFSLILYAQIFMLSQKPEIVENLAFHFVQVVYVPIDQATEHRVAPESKIIHQLVMDPTAQFTIHEFNKKTDVLALQIRTEIVNESNIVRYNNFFANGTNQLIFIWTMVYIIRGLTRNTESCDYWAYLQTYVYGFLLFVQYSHYYLMALVLLIMLPFILIYLLVKHCKDRKARQMCSLALERLQENVVKYQPNVIPGEQECSICMQPYNTNDEVLALPCNPLHHFHNACISAWLNIQTTCPACRQSVLPQEAQAPLLQDFSSSFSRIMRKFNDQPSLISYCDNAEVLLTSPSYSSYVIASMVIPMQFSMNTIVVIWNIFDMALLAGINSQLDIDMNSKTSQISLLYTSFDGRSSL